MSYAYERPYDSATPHVSRVQKSYADDIREHMFTGDAHTHKMRVIDEAFNPAFLVWSKLAEIIPTGVRFWIAGGAFPALIHNNQYNADHPDGPHMIGVNDWDVFSDQPDKVIEAIRAYVAVKTPATRPFDVFSMEAVETFANEHLVNFTVPGIMETVQVIKRPFASPAETIGQFDFTACMFALEGLTVTYTYRATWDAFGKVIRPNVITYPLNTLKRMTKYASRGYNVHQATFIEVTKGILSLESIDADSLTDNMFYLQGHPK